METNDDTEGQAAVQSDTDEVQSPATFTQNQKPSLTVKLPLHSSIPEPVNSEDNYEADDEEEHLHPKPTTTSQPLSKNNEQEDQLLKLQQMIEVMGQKTVYKILELLISERIKTARLTDNIKHLQNENDTFKARFSSQGNERHTPPAPERSISADIPIPLFVETPMTHRYQESKKEVPDTPQMSEIEEILNDQNDKLKDELAELKAKKMQEDLKLQQEITALKKELKVGNKKSVQTNDKQVTANKKQNIVIAGDSMLNNIEDQYNLNTKKANVSIRAFPGSTIEDFKDYITPLAQKKPDALIIHTGANNVHNDTPPQFTEKLIQLHKYVKSVSRETKVVLSNIIRGHDYQKEHLSKKVIDINTLLAVECRHHKKDLIIT